MQNPFSEIETVVLQDLLKTLYTLNLADHEDTDMSPQLAGQGNAYGHVYKAIESVVDSRIPENPRGCFPVLDFMNYSGHENPWEDLLAAVEDFQNQGYIIEEIDKLRVLVITNEGDYWEGELTGKLKFPDDWEVYLETEFHDPINGFKAVIQECNKGKVSFEEICAKGAKFEGEHKD